MYIISGRGRKSGVARATEATASLAPLSILNILTPKMWKIWDTGTLKMQTKMLEIKSGQVGTQGHQKCRQFGTQGH